MSPTEGKPIRNPYLPVVLLAAFTLTGQPAQAWEASAPQAARIAQISRVVFGDRWRVAACIAHYESTDGAHLFNGSNLGPWQINVDAHTWVNRKKVVHDWTYPARVAYRISGGGRNWRPWTTHRLCNV